MSVQILQTKTDTDLQMNSNNALETLISRTEDPGSVCDTTMYRLPYFQASLFATVLEDTITELRILVECNSELSLSKAHVDLDLLLALKFQVAQPPVKDELEGIDVKNLGCIKYKINKLDADRRGILNKLQDIYFGLSVPRTYEVLADQVLSIVRKIEHYDFLVEDEAKNRVYRRELCKQLRQRRNNIKSVYYDTDCVIESLRTQVEDASLTSEIQSRYVDNWQRARMEQTTQHISDMESGPFENIEDFKQKIDAEQRVHTEVELLVTIAINETLEKVENWMDKYDKDIEGMDLKIQRMRTSHITTMEKRQLLEQTFEKHDTQIKEWVHFKEEREKARLYREKMQHAATVVQAWWRGLLVRNQLGPYKPKPKGKGKAADKKK